MPARRNAFKAKDVAVDIGLMVSTGDAYPAHLGDPKVMARRRLAVLTDEISMTVPSERAYLGMPL